MTDENTAPAEGATPEATSTTPAPSDDVARLKAALDKERALRKEAEKGAKSGAEAAARLAEIDAANASDLEKAVKAARAEGVAEALRTANARLISAEVRALAAEARFRDPADALAQLRDDLADVTVADDGTVDADAIRSALKDLSERKPYLLADQPDPIPTPGAAGIGVTGSAVLDNSPHGLIRAGLEQSSARSSRR